MKYTIKEILPAQIFVEFEDGSTAFVPVSPESTPEEIDHAVSQYDPDFLPDPQTLINQNISVDEERESKQIQVLTLTPPTPTQTSEVLPTNFSESSNPIFPTLNFGVASSLDVIVLSDYYASQGDARLKDALNSKIETLISDPNFSLDTLIQGLNYNPEDIMAQAEAELNAEQS